jgi:hypothetical protein
MARTAERQFGSENVLFFGNGFELDSVVCVYPPTRGAAPVEVLLDMMPAKATNLTQTMVR